MGRSLNAVEEKVLEIAKDFEKSHYDWAAPNIQFKGWPETDRYMSVELGISSAIQHLLRVGAITRTGRGTYRITRDV